MTIKREIDKDMNFQEISKIQLIGTDKQIAEATNIRRRAFGLSKMRLKQLKCIIVLKKYDMEQVEDKKSIDKRREEIIRLEDLYNKMLQILKEDFYNNSAKYFIEVVSKNICEVKGYRDIYLFENYFTKDNEEDWIYYLGAIRDVGTYARHYDFNVL